MHFDPCADSARPDLVACRNVTSLGLRSTRGKSSMNAMLACQLLSPAAMKTLKIGIVLLTVWCGLEIVVAAWVTAVTFAGGPPPALALVMSKARISTVDPIAVAVINAQAAILNPCICVVCTMALVLAWRGLARGQRWTLWLLTGTLLPLQVTAFGSDNFLGHRNLSANLISTLMLTAPLALCGAGSRRTVEGAV